MSDAIAFDRRRENAAWLRLALRRLRLRLYEYALLRAPNGERAADWIVAADDAELGTAPSAELEAQIKSLEQRMRGHEECLQAHGQVPALLAVASLADLDSFEQQLLLLAAAPALDGAFAAAYAQLHGDARRSHATLHLALSLYVPDTTERLLAGDRLLPMRPLRSLGLIDLDDDAREPLLLRGLRVDDRMADFLRGANRVDTRVQSLLRPLGEAQEHAAGIEAAARIAAAPGRWTTINLVGDLDRGAAGAVRGACASLDLRPQRLDVAQLAPLALAERTRYLGLLGREALLANLAYVVDCAALGGQRELHALVDELIDSLGATLFVVSRERWPARVPLHYLPVTAPTREEQRVLWKSALNGHAVELESEVDAIVQQFDLSGTAIADVVARAGAQEGIITGAQLWRACREQANPAIDEFARKLTPCFGWNDIVVSAEVRAQLQELAAQVEQRGRVYETWGFGASLARGRGITALFAGPSGTGKTMAAEILAAQLHLDIYRIDLAGVISKYIGETEKNLRKVFDAAEHSGAILFFDEADSLFGTRTEVRDSHDRYANLEVNYLLQRMEDYSGLAILATNRRSALDSALPRRLRFVIDFPFPGPDDRRQIWERAFPALAPTQDLQFSFLSKLDLSGGNIKSIAINAAFIAAEERTPIGMATVMRAAAREYSKLSRPVNAAEFGDYLPLAQKR
jgi:autotransporter translocation and assembly factor TamB